MWRISCSLALIVTILISSLSFKVSKKHLKSYNLSFITTLPWDDSDLKKKSFNLNCLT